MFSDAGANLALFQSVLCPQTDSSIMTSDLQNVSMGNFSEYSTNDTADYMANTTQSAGNGAAMNLYHKMEDMLQSRVGIVVGILGLVGNILNVLVLTQKGLQTSMGRMEKFAHTGLISLAVSDMLFCLMILPHAFVSTHKYHFTAINFEMLYNIYSHGFINIFILSSTMLTVTMAAGRYCAIVHPLRARQFFGMTCARRMIIFVYVSCVAFNLPRFWRYKIIVVECETGETVYFRADGAYKDFEVTYLCCYFVIGVLLPLVVLAYSNIFLIRALRQSKNRIIRFRKNETQQESSHLITLTLVIIIIFYMLLIIPAEFITVMREIIKHFGINISSDQFNLGVAIVNVLQTVNFSFNFVLYCLINTHFRRIVVNAIKCRCAALLNNRRGVYDSEGVAGSGTGTSVRSSGQTSLRTVLYSARLQTNRESGRMHDRRDVATTQL